MRDPQERELKRGHPRCKPQSFYNPTWVGSSSSFRHIPFIGTESGSSTHTEPEDKHTKTFIPEEGSQVDMSEAA